MSDKKVVNEKKVVGDKQKSIEFADTVSSKILKLIMEETKNYDCADDPAEQIYLSVHILGSLMVKLCISLESYGKIYDIPKLNYHEIKKWVNTISDEHFKQLKDIL